MSYPKASIARKKIPRQVYHHLRTGCKAQARFRRSPRTNKRKRHAGPEPTYDIHVSNKGTFQHLQPSTTISLLRGNNTWKGRRPEIMTDAARPYLLALPCPPVCPTRMSIRQPRAALPAHMGPNLGTRILLLSEKLHPHASCPDPSGKYLYTLVVPDLRC